jgi:general transcription factor 3C polypeptide 3 (transcription factor C subunit 4)
MNYLNIIHLACARYANSIPDVAIYARWFMQTYQFRSDPFRLYYLVLGTSIDSIEQFRAPVDQKFLLRQIKAIDGVLRGEPVPGAAAIVDDKNVEKLETTQQSPVLLTLYGHRLAAGGNYVAAQGTEDRRKGNALGYYYRARGLGVSDPLLELSIGLTYIHRAMQRQADNRHILILQGMTFLFQYYHGINERAEKYEGLDAAGMRQQAEYNIGRAFHQLGLLTFAIKYYEKVVEISDEWEGKLKRDLVFEAVHNMTLIYALSGNMGAVKELTEKYLVL